MDTLAESVGWHIPTVLMEGEPVEEILPFELVGTDRSQRPAPSLICATTAIVVRSELRPVGLPEKMFSVSAE